MRKRVLAAVLVAAGVIGSVTAAFGGGASLQAGPENYGICNAYGRGSANGQAHKHQAGPFADLEAAAEAADQTVAEYCAENHPKPGN